MSHLSRENLVKSLDALVFKTMEVIAELLLENKIHPEENLFYREKVTMAGPKSWTGLPEHYMKQTWGGARFQVLNIVETTAEYKSLLASMGNELVNLGGGRVANSTLLQQFIQKITTHKLTLADLAAEEIRREVEALAATYFQEPKYFTAKVEISGLNLESTSIEVMAEPYHINLRQMIAEDLEVDEEALYSRYNSRDPFDFMSAILIISQKTAYPHDFLKIKDKVVSVLRLFKVGNVRSLKTTFTTEDKTYNMLINGAFTDARGMAGGEYTLTRNDESRFREFWAVIYDKIHTNFYDSSSPSDFLSIAFNRYSDSLLIEGGHEKRIATAVMGLESLYSENKPEISYRLQKRIAKIFGLLEYPALDINNVIKHAYTIRCNYVHGNLTTRKEMDKLIAKVKIVESDGDLLFYLQNLLRISIIVILISNLSKASLLDMLDNALIDAGAEKEVDSILEMTKSLIG